MTPTPQSRRSPTEFILLTGMIMAAVAFGTDAMMPAMTEIGEDLTPDAPNQAQLVISAFFLGVGIGTFVTGPLSDRFGRRPIMMAGLLLYATAALLAWVAPSLELLLLARVFQGLGAAGPRVTVMAVVRDQFEGRRMAQIMSFAMMVFVLVPAVAPMLGAWIMAIADWRAIFVAFALWAAVMAVWFGLRQPETLAPELRRPLRPMVLLQGMRQILTTREVVLSIIALTCVFGVLIATLQSSQPIFEFTHDRAEAFPYIFAVISLISALGSLLNAKIVARFGMKTVALAALSAVALASLGLLAAEILPLQKQTQFILLLVYLQVMFFCTGMTIGNISAIAMRPLGNLAGLGASMVSALSTIGGLGIGVPIGLAFDGTALPLGVGAFLATVLSGLVMTRVPMDEA